jgi:predicted transposase/invertase (TIGR01784 family)
VLFDEKKENVNNYSEQVYLTRNRTKEKFTDKLNLIFVELPKFTKEKTELETNADLWLYSLKHAKELTSQPAEIKGKIFDKLYETLEIEQLTEEQMETYDKSILKYRDVRSAVELAEERYFARGIEEGVKRGIRQGIERGLMSAQETFAKRCLQNNLPIEMVSKLTGLTPEQLIDIR